MVVKERKRVKEAGGDIEVTIRGTKVLGGIIGSYMEAYRSGAKRHLWLEGGTWSSKTWSVLQFIKLLGDTEKQIPLIISVISETVPHLKRGAIRDFEQIMAEDWDTGKWNGTDLKYEFPNPNVEVIVEFFSADVPSKLRGGRRDILFINEANNITYEAFKELDMRTRLFTICDWNPVSEFWYHGERLGELVGSDYIHSTYRDALEVIPAAIVQDIESYKERDVRWWTVYGLGELGDIEGLVHPAFDQVDELPEGKINYGLDFGFLVDPTVLVTNVIMGGHLYSHQMFYSRNKMTNEDIGRKMDLLGVRESNYSAIYTDTTEPKSIEELKKMGFNVKPSVKGPGSVEYGIQKVNQYYQHWTKDSLECIKEQRNYRYLSKDGNLTPKTTHKWSHGMDARRYAVAGEGVSGGVGKPLIRRSAYKWG